MIKNNRFFYWLPILIIAFFAIFAILPEHFFIHNHLPFCLFKNIFHIDCVGCGTLRGLNAIFHGELAQAWAFNPLSYFWLGGGFFFIIYICIQLKNKKASFHDT